MPIFEYLCSSCGASSEKLQRQPLDEIACPSCGRPARRSVSRFAVPTSGDGGGCGAPSGSGFA